MDSLLAQVGLGPFTAAGATLQHPQHMGFGSAGCQHAQHQHQQPTVSSLMPEAAFVPASAAAALSAAAAAAAAGSAMSGPVAAGSFQEQPSHTAGLAGQYLQCPAGSNGPWGVAAAAVLLLLLALLVLCMLWSRSWRLRGAPKKTRTAAGGSKPLAASASLPSKAEGSVSARAAGPMAGQQQATYLAAWRAQGRVAPMRIVIMVNGSMWVRASWGSSWPQALAARYSWLLLLRPACMSPPWVQTALWHLIYLAAGFACVKACGPCLQPAAPRAACSPTAPCPACTWPSTSPMLACPTLCVHALPDTYRWLAPGGTFSLRSPWP